MIVKTMKEKPMTPELKEILEKTSTRELLVWLARSRRFGGYYSPTGYSGSSFSYSSEEIKQVLATRPHVKKAKGKNR